MVTRIIYIIVIFILSAFSYSCNEIEKQNYIEEIKDNSKIGNLTGNKNKEWKVISYTKNGVDVLTEMDKCIQDNLDVYFCDHRFESVEGEQKCNDDDPYICETGYWYFNEDSTEIEITIEKEFYILKLIELSETKFHYISTNHEDTVETVLTVSSTSLSGR